MSESSYHPVIPQISDPDAVSSAAGSGRRGGADPYAGERYPRRDRDAPADVRIDVRDDNDGAIAYGGRSVSPAPQKSFFQEHKFAIIVSAIVLLIIIVVLYMYLTRKGDKRKKAQQQRIAGGIPDGDDPGARGAPPEGMGYAPPRQGGAPPAGKEVDIGELSRLREMRRKSREAGGGAPDSAGDPSAGGRGSPMATTVGIAIPHPAGMRGHGAPPQQGHPGVRPPPATPAARPKNAPPAPASGQSTPPPPAPRGDSPPARRPTQPRQAQESSTPPAPRQQGARPPAMNNRPAQPAKPGAKAPPVSGASPSPAKASASTQAQAQKAAAAKAAAKAAAAQAQSSSNDFVDENGDAIDDDDGDDDDDDDNNEDEQDDEDADDEFGVDDVYQGAIDAHPPAAAAHAKPDDFDMLIDSLADSE